MNVNTSAPINTSPYFSYGYIDDDDPTMSVTSVSPEYVQEGAGSQVFSVTLSSAQAYPISFEYQTMNGNALSGDDYNSASGTLTFSPGQTTKQITVSILNDFVVEPQKYYHLQISNAQNANNSAAITINTNLLYAYIDDDDPNVSMGTVNPEYVMENAGTQVFTVNLSAPQTYSVSVHYQSYDNYAISGNDYVGVNGTLVFAPGETSKTFAITILEDYLQEYSENYFVYIDNAQNVNASMPMTIGSLYYAFANIEDNDPSISISAPSPEYVAENGGTQLFTATLSSPQTYSVSFHYQTNDYYATAGTDYVATSGVLTFAPGQTTKTFTVSILDDNLNEYPESYYVSLDNAQHVNAAQPMTISNNYSYAYIDDNDPILSISTTAPDTLSESGGAQWFTINMSSPQTYSVSVQYQANSNSAVAGTDFVATNGTLIFAPGETSKTLSVTLLNDYLNEGVESFYVSIDSAKNLSNSLPMTIGYNQYYAYAYISDNDPLLNLVSPSPATLMESSTGAFAYSVTLSAVQPYPVSVNYQTTNFEAMEGTDFIAANGTLTFLPGESSKTFTITCVDDYLNESAEMFYVTLSNAQNTNAMMPMSIDSNNLFVTIADNDPIINIIPTSSPASALENGGTQLFTITLSSPQTYPVSVDYYLSDGSANAGIDFTFGICALTVTFAPGETSKVFTSSIIDDGIAESTENYVANISNAKNVSADMPMTILSYASYAYILDNDNAGCGANVLAKPVISGSTLYCPNTTINLAIAAVPGAIGYVWNGPNGFTAAGTSITISNASALHSGIYTARAYRAGATVCDTSVGANVSVSVLPCASTVSLKVYIEGYYVDSGKMTTVLLNHGLIASTTTTDSINVELHSATAPFGLVASVRTALNTNGTAIATYPSISGLYYLAIRHPSAVTTWSALPVSIGALPTSYDFTNAASKAFGNNMVEVESGIWGIYNGDLNQDENTDLIDLSILEERVSTFDTCFLPADLNGDGNTDLLDSPILENNINLFIYSAKPE